jgi:hypothetical protein
MSPSRPSCTEIHQLKLTSVRKKQRRTLSQAFDRSPKRLGGQSPLWLSGLFFLRRTGLATLSCSLQSEQRSNPATAPNAALFLPASDDLIRRYLNHIASPLMPTESVKS